MNPPWTLRRASMSDVAALHELLCDPYVYRFLADGSPPPASLARTWVTSNCLASDPAVVGLWILRRISMDQILGAVRLDGPDEQAFLELTYLLHPSVIGKGLATRMSHTVVANAFRSGSVSGVWAGTDTPNTASLSVMQRLGMSFYRDVTYPQGSGVEYRCSREQFDPSLHETLPIEESGETEGA